MELVKDIYFNTDKLIENTKVKVSYTGKFYQTNNDKVYIHYGYGSNWNNLNEVEMLKTDLGYQSEISLTGGDTLNFCFKNQDNEWDNNFGKNYVFNIEKTSQNELGKTTVGTTNTNNVFWGKTFQKEEVPAENQSNIWNCQSQNTVEQPVPQSIDTVIPNKQNVVQQQSSQKTNYEKAFAGNVIQKTTASEIKLNGVPTPTFQKAEVTIQPNVNVNTPNVNTIGTVTANTVANNAKIQNKIATNIVNPVKQETSIALAPTGFNYWTKRIKDTVCKFFAYVPKLISGNYKRNISNDKKQ